MSIKYYATEEYVDEAVAGLGGGATSWNDLTDKPFYKTNQTVLTLSSETASDSGEGATNGRYSNLIVLNDLDNLIPNYYDNNTHPWTFIFDGESFTIKGRRLPILMSNPTSKVKMFHAYQHGDDVRVEFSYDEPGEHNLIFEAGEYRYVTLAMEYMPKEYPKILAEFEAVTSLAAVGTLSSDGQTYSYSLKDKAIEAGQKYRIKFRDIECILTAEINNDGMVVLGSPTIPYSNPAIYVVYDAANTTTTIYWNAVDGQTGLLSIYKVNETVKPLDEKFLPEHQHTTSWNNLEDKPFGVKTELIAAIPEQEYTFNSIGGGIYFKQVGPYPMLDYNKQKYVVMMNNERYDCIPSAGYTDDSGTLRCLLGNETFDSDIENAQDTGEPFFIYSDPSGYTNILVNAKGPHRVGVYEEQEVVEPLDEKFLPDTVARKADIEEAITAHNHIIDDITDLQTTLNSKALQSDLELLANDCSTKADREHNHNDVYYTEAEIDTLLSEMASIERGGTGQTSIVDTTYVEPRYRASALVAIETTPTENGVITWVYE